MGGGARHVKGKAWPLGETTSVLSYTVCTMDAVGIRNEGNEPHLSKDDPHGAVLEARRRVRWSSPNSSSNTERAMSIRWLRAQAFTSAVAAMLSGCTPSRAISASCSVACTRPAPACLRPPAAENQTVGRTQQHADPAAKVLPHCRGRRL